MAPKNSENRRSDLYEKFLDSIHDPLCAVDSDLVIVYANNGYKNMLAQLNITGEITGKKLMAVCPFLPGTISEEYRNVFSTGKTVITEEVSEVDGVKHYSETTKSPVFDAAGAINYVMTVIRDVNARKQAEEALRKSEKRYRGLIESQNDLIVRVDPDNRFTYVNDTYCKTFGKSREELIGKSFAPLVHKDDIEHTLKVMEGLQKPPYRIQVEQRAMTVEGWRWLHWEDNAILNESGSIVEIQGVGRDITELKETEKKIAGETIKKSEERYREILDSLEEIFFELDLSGNITYCNQYAARLFGYTRDELIGRNYKHFFRDPKIISLVLNKIRQSSRPERLSSLEMVCSDSSVVYGDISFSPAKDRDGGIVGFRVAGRDITEWKRMEDLERRRNQILTSIATGKPLEEVLELIVGLIETEDPDALGSILLLDDQGQHLLYGAGSSLPEFYNQAIHGLKIGEGVGSCGTAAYRGQRVIVEDILTHPYWADFRKLAKKANLRSCWSEPIFSADGKVIATFATYHRIPRSPNEADFERFKRAADLASLAIEYKQAEKQLVEAHRLLDQIIEFSPDAMFVIDTNGIVVAWNKAIEEMTGITKKDMVGQGNYEYAIHFYGKRRPILIDLALIPEGELNRYKDDYDVIGWKGNILYSETHVPGVYSGKGAYLWATASKLYDTEGNVVGAIETLRDITERKRYEEQLKYLSLHDQLTGLHNRVYFDNELKRLDNSREYPITIISTDLDNLKLINETMGHDIGDEYLKACAGILKKSLRGSDILVRAGGDEFVAILPRADRKAGEMIAGRIFSQINLYNQKRYGQLPLKISLGLSTAEDESKPLKETLIEADELLFRDKLHRGAGASYQIIESLMAVLGERDFITEGHVRRLENLANKMGERFNLSQKQLSNLILLTKVHDLGKVGIPDRILFKESLLDDEEWNIMRQHSEKGYRIALASEDLSEIAGLILRHHERWDGGGYPLGLKGEKIPVECRILAIIDAYDAMVNNRPYRKAMSKTEAVEELKRNAGTQFDPELVAVFLLILEEASDE